MECPLRVLAVALHGGCDWLDDGSTECVKGKCAWWIDQGIGNAGRQGVCSIKAAGHSLDDFRAVGLNANVRNER